jgi:hypothetical protein
MHVYTWYSVLFGPHAICQFHNTMHLHQCIKGANESALNSRRACGIVRSMQRHDKEPSIIRRWCQCDERYPNPPACMHSFYASWLAASWLILSHPQMLQISFEKRWMQLTSEESTGATKNGPRQRRMELLLPISLRSILSPSACQSQQELISAGYRLYQTGRN